MLLGELRAYLCGAPENSSIRKSELVPALERKQRLNDGEALSRLQFLCFGGECDLWPLVGCETLLRGGRG